MFKRDVPGKTRFNPYMMLLLLAGVVAVAYVALGVSLLRQGPGKDDLLAELKSGMAVLAAADDVQQEMEVLPDRLAEARQELQAAQEAFPTELNSNNTMQTILELAGESQVDVRSVDALPPVEESADESSTETTITYDVEVEGDLGQLMAFLEALEGGDSSTTKISTFSLEEAEGRYLLDFELVAYARSTASEAASPEQGSAEGQAVIPATPQPASSPEQGSVEGRAVIPVAPQSASSPEQGSTADEGAEATGDGEETPRE
jgi:hypothetical protein